MEQKLIEELEKSKSGLRTLFSEKLSGNVSEKDIEFILGSIDKCVFGMVQVMKEGKSIHEKFFSDIILNSIDAIIGINNDDNIFLWNKGAENILGYAKEEVLGQKWGILIPPILRKRGEIELMRSKIKEDGFISNYETERLTKNGDIKNVSITRFVLYNDRKEVLGSVGIVRDITKEKHLEKELREKENLALIGEVVSSIAHNLSNPLNIISGNADYLLLDKNEKTDGYEELKIILDETTRITKSIRQILNFSKPVNLTKENSDMNALLSSVIDRAKFLATNKIIEFKKSFTSDIPMVKIDKEQISDVFLNIINNGIQAISNQGTVKVKTHLKDNNVIIELSDTGNGIPESNLDKIFKPFFSTKEYGKGTGLGLAFADRIIKEHKGKIEVKSSLGLGSDFIISLPV
jgi:PAS domain S-box-containing protein